VGSSSAAPPQLRNGTFEVAVSARLDRVEAALKRHDRFIKSAVEIGVQLLEGRR
jgi:hypothetical protein